MPYIGSVACYRVIGTLPVPKMRLAVWTVPGLNGYGAQDMGLQDQAFEVTAVLYDINVNVHSWKDALCALQGQIVTIIDDHGETTANCLIVEVGQAKIEAALGPTFDQRGEVPIRGVIRA